MTVNKNLIRMCAYTHENKPVTEMFHIVRTSGGVLLERNEKLFGRGAYLSKDKSVILSAKNKHTLSRALRCEVKDDIYDQMLALF